MNNLIKNEKRKYRGGAEKRRELFKKQMTKEAEKCYKVDKMFKSSGCKLLTLTTPENVYNNNCSSTEDSSITVSSKVLPKLLFKR